MRSFTKKIVLFLLAFAGLFTGAVNGQSILDPTDVVVTYNAATPPTQPAFGQIGKWVRTKRVSWNSDDFKAYIFKGVQFRLKYPKSYNPAANDGKRYPMLVFFHGLGETGNIYDNEYSLVLGGTVFQSAVNNDKFDGYVMVMQSPTGWGGTQFSALTGLIDYMTINNKLSPFQITANGLSAGGYASWDLMIDYMPYIAQALPMSGVSISHKDAAKVEKYKFTPIWLFQGGLDGSPAPYTAQQVKDAIDAAGGNLRYTLYPNLGHGTWNTVWAEPDFFPTLNRAYSSNPHTLFGRTEFCVGDNINLTIGLAPGFDAYEWRKNGVLIAGATTNKIQVTQIGVYDARVRKGSLWSEWSRIPANIKIKAPTVTPPIAVSGIMSKVLPALDSNKVTLKVPTGYTSYLWQKVGSSTTLSTDSTLIVSTPGDYRVKVTELYGCSSEFSPSFTVVNANGPNKPDAPINLSVTTLSKTSLQLNWSDNPAPQNNETNFEVYQASTPGGPYKIIGITGQDVVSFTVNGLNSNSTYYFKLRAVNNTGASAVNSNEASGTTANDEVNPAAPANLVITSTTRTSISLSWNAASDDVGVTRYEIYINGQKSYSTTDTTFIANALETGENYNFTVRAQDFAGNLSPYSNQVTGQAILSGLNYKYYHGSTTWSVLPDFNTLTPVKTGIVTNFSIEPRTRNDNIGFLYEGYIKITTPGSYTFRTNSDDGSKLYLGALNAIGSPYSHTATALVNNDGSHGTQNRDGTVTLEVGTYPIAVTYYNGTGGYAMTVTWRTPSSGTNFVAIPNSALSDPVTLPESAPAIPSNLTASALSFKAISLQWLDNSTNETGFEIYRSGSLNGTYSTIAIAPANTVNYIDSTVAPSTTYYYKIRAIGTYGESGLTYQNTEANWPLDNNYVDVSGKNRVLTPTGGPTFDAVNVKQGSHSVKLNGSTSSLLINTDDGYLKGVYSEKTVALWIKSSSNTGNKMIIDIGGNDDGLSLRLDANLLYAGIASNNARRSFSVPYTSTEWNHIALVYSTNSLKIYLNGVEAGGINDIAFTALGTTTNGSRIGTQEGNNAFNVTGNRFTGLMDNVSIFSTALSQDAIIAHMNNSSGQSNATTLDLPVLPNTPTDLEASASGTNSVNVHWNYNATTTGTTTIPGATTRVEGESYFAMNGVATETCSEGGLNVRAIDPNDWMDYNVNLATAGTCTVSFRVSTTGNTTGQFQLRTSDEQILATLNIPKTTNIQTYTTITTTVTLPAGPQTLRIFALKNAWNLNWFEITTGSNTNTSTTTANASAFELYRSANTNGNYVLLTTLPGTTTSYVDAGLFANSVFYYKVKAVNVGGSSAESNEDSAKTLNTAPVISSIGDRSVRYATTLSIPVSATDADGGALSFALSNSPSFATLVNNGNNQAVINLNPAVGNEGVYSGIKVIVNDINGGSDTALFNLTVNDNYSPAIDSIINYSVIENDSVSIALSASDLNTSDSLVWSVSNLPDTYELIPSSNGSAVLKVKPTFAGSGVYAVQVTVNDGEGGIATRQFNLTVADKNPNTRIYARVKYANNIGAPWNSLNGVTTNNLKDEFNNNTTVGINFSPNWWLPYNAGPVTGNNSGVYPDAVLNDFWYFGYYGGPETANVSVTGLNPAGKYNLTFYAGSVFGSVSDNGTTNYTVGSKTVSLYVQNNTQNTVSLNDLAPDASGTITVNMTKGANTPIGYLNALVITSLYNDGTAPAAPKALTAQNVAGQGVKLNWTDAAFNESGYEVYRSTSLPGTFSLLDTAASGSTTYIDGTVSGATQYFYKLRAINDDGVSAYTDTVSLTTINRIPQIAPIANLQVKNNQSVTVNVSATDDATDHITLTASGLPSFVSFVDNGNGTGVLSVNPSADLLGTFQGLTITAKDNSDSSRSVTFSIFVVDANIASTYVNFTSTESLAPQPWNNMAIGYLPFAGTSVTGLKDDSNNNTGVAVTLTDAWQAVSATGQRLRNGTELYPESVLRTGIYFTDGNTHRITVTGLNTAKKYNFQFMNSHGTSENTNTNFTINGQTVSLSGSYNSNKVIQLNGITPAANGQVVINVTKDAGAVYGMLSSLVIQAYTPGVVTTFSPLDLRVTDRKTTSVSLQWQDRADNETGYEISRSTDGVSYSPLVTLPANTTSYVNTGLSRNANYYYIVRAVNGGGYSAYSNAIKAYTYASSVSINMSTSASVAANPWNNLNWQLGVGSVWNNFIDDRLVATNVGMVQTDAFDGLYNAGVNTGNNSGIYPDKVMAENFGLFPGASARIKIKGLNYSKTYDFDIFASAQETYGDVTGAYTINGKTCLLNANRNKSGILVMSGITPDENGEVDIRVTTFTGSSFGLLGALVINAYDATSTTAPAPPSGGSGARVAVSTVSPLVAEIVEETPKALAALSAYPNPFDQALTVSVPALDHDNIQVSMVDLTGRLVYQKRFDNLFKGNNIIRIQSDKSVFVPGTYLLRVSYINRNEQKVIKVIKR